MYKNKLYMPVLGDWGWKGYKNNMYMTSPEILLHMFMQYAIMIKLLQILSYIVLYVISVL